MNFFYKETKSDKKKNSGGWEGRGGCGGVARVSDFFFLFFQKSPSLKKKSVFFFEGVKVREDWLV